MANRDMALVATLAAKFAEVDAMPPEPIKTVPRKTGRSKAEARATGTLTDQRSMLGDIPVTVILGANGTLRATCLEDI
jgi:hypothetical protein